MKERISREPEARGRQKLIQQTFTLYLLCATHCGRHWMRATDPCPPGESIPVGEANSKPEKVKYAVQEMLILRKTK